MVSLAYKRKSRYYGELLLIGCKKINDGALYMLGEHKISKTIKSASFERNRDISEAGEFTH